jgi:predicted RNA-binding Zn-ribbon protein involved in translation (DUF1610 family)
MHFMAAKAGEIARETTMYACESCRRALPVHDGAPIPNCPSCGSGSFHTGVRTLRNETTVAAPAGFASFP